jgi:phosphonate transport system ATP-binding protein
VPGAAVRIEHLTKVYADGTKALTDITLSVKPGEFLVIIGLSGSGKSTLMRCINRLIEPPEGKIFVDDVEITALPPEQMP